MSAFVINRPCKSPGCSALVAAGQGSYCPAHRRQSTVNRQLSDRSRGTAAERGYDSRWQQARAGWLARYPLCCGVLIATLDYTPALARTFHELREIEREAGRLIGPAGGLPERLVGWLRHFPIYHHEPWDLSRPATVIDHIIPHKGDSELFWAEWNWQPLTKRAHDKKTAREEKQR